MQKTKAGISLGAACAIIYFTALFGGYIPLFLLGGYVFIKENDPWLKKAVFKAAVLLLVFSALIAVIDTLNEFLGIFSNLLNWELEIPFNIDRVFKNVINIAKTIMFSVIGFKSLGQKDVPIPTIDNAFCCESDSSANANK